MGQTGWTKPLRRVGQRGDGRYEEISWEAAIELVHEGLPAPLKTMAPVGSCVHYAGPLGNGW